jgi:hypothetical protein
MFAMSRSALASLGAFLLFTGVAVVVTNHLTKDLFVSLPNSRSLRAIVAEDSAVVVPGSSDEEIHPRYAAFQFDRDLVAAAQDSALSNIITKEYLPYKGRSLPFKLPQDAADWCLPPSLHPLDYNACDPNKTINRLPLYGGLTNALKMLLLGIIDSLEQDRCFYVDEAGSELMLTDADGKTHSLIKRYFEPIGLDPDSIVVQKALREGRVETKSWEIVWAPLDKRRVLADTFHIPALSVKPIDGHTLKVITMMRMWRPFSLVRNTACMALEQQGLNDEFMAMSVRRGDKSSVEHFEYPTAEDYIVAAERAVPIHFNNIVPKIFVATDDCLVVGELRALKPDWTFVSQCDVIGNAADHGFALTDMKAWSELDMDRHYEKFFAELLGLSIAKYFIGVTYTNVSWWVLFMRRARAAEMEFLDHKQSPAAFW